MPDDPANKRLRQPAPHVIDQRQQQIDPAGKQRIDPNARPPGNRKQPGAEAPDPSDPGSTAPRKA
jgi:hypothetical protein